MTVVSRVAFDPTFPLRIATSILAVATLVGVVAAGVAIGVIVGRQTDPNSAFVQTKFVVKSDISIAIYRLITSIELAEYYNASATLLDVSTSVNAQIKQYFPQTSVKVVISGFSGEPIFVSDNDRKLKRQLSNHPSIIIVNGSAYFTENYTGNDLRKSFNNYSRTIVLTDMNGRPSPALGIFSSRYSNFTDTYSTTLTIEQVEALAALNITASTVLNTSTTTTIVNATITSLVS